MNVGLFTDGLAHRSLPDALGWLAGTLPEVRHVELGVGGYSPVPHCEPARLLESEAARAELTAELEAHGLQLAALNVSGNPLEIEAHDRALREAVQLAALLGVERIVCMSGGRAELAGAGWFEGLEDETERYWTDRVLPYWAEVAELARSEDEGLLLCLELEPGSAAFNVSTFERLAAVGPNLAVNLDPSHFMWQGIDPLAAVRRLGRRVGYAHGKDTVLTEERIALDGLLDRSAWRYATVGHGHDLAWWRELVDELRAAGYDGPISIEYEDPLTGPEESVAEAAQLLVAAARPVEVST